MINLKTSLKVTLNKTKNILIEKEFKKLRTFGNNGSQNLLIFQPIHKTLTNFSDLPNKIAEW